MPHAGPVLAQGDDVPVVRDMEVERARRGGEPALADEGQLLLGEAAGRLDWLISEALDDLDAGRCTDR